MKRNFFKLSFLLFVVLNIVIGNVVLIAQADDSDRAAGTPTGGGGSPVSTPSVGTPVPLNNPVTGNAGYKPVEKIANSIIKGSLGLTGSLAMIAFVWGGITWLTSGGDTNKITKGKTMMIWATIGIIVIFSSYAIVNFIFETLNVI